MQTRRTITWMADARRPARDIATLLASTICAFAVAGCSDVSNRAAVYEELLPATGLDESREYALRITLFEYAHEVGGFVEIFHVDGTRNSALNPYFEPEACAYFGSGRIANDEFPIDVSGPEGRFLMRSSLLDGGRRMTGRVVEDGGLFEPIDGVRAVEFERSPVAPQRSCDNAPYPADGSGLPPAPSKQQTSTE